MRIEQIPLILGVLVALAGLGFVIDAWLSENRSWRRERRRRRREERHRPGEALIGLGVIALGAALIGRDNWSYGTIAVLAGAVLLILGAFLNRRYLRELLLFRGPTRRGEKRQEPRAADTPGREATPRSLTPPTSSGQPIERERPIQTARLADTGERPLDGDSSGGDERMRIR